MPPPAQAAREGDEDNGDIPPAFHEDLTLREMKASFKSNNARFQGHLHKGQPLYIHTCIHPTNGLKKLLALSFILGVEPRSDSLSGTLGQEEEEKEGRRGGSN